MEALLNYDNSADTQAIRDRVQASIAGQPVDAFARAKAQSVGTTTSCGTGAPFVWTPFSGQTYWLSFATKGDLLRESIALQLHQHIPVNFWVNVNGGLGGGCSSQWTYLSYIDLLRVHALGRPPQTADERPVTGNFKNFITDLLTDYQMALYLTHIQSRFLSGGYWQWQVGVQNNNFARELLQLFTLGQYNVFTGALNYSENDVQEVARALAGNVNEYSANLPSVPALRQTPWRHHGLTEGRWIENLPNHREPGTKLIFESAQAPVRKQGNLTTVDVVDSIVNHSGFAYVPRMFFSRSVYPGVSSGMVQALDQFFRGNNFSVPTLFRKLMSSEATFSLKARYGSIASGTLHLLRLINTLQLPVRNTSAAATDSGASYGLVVNQMRAMGDAPFEAPSVFGYGESGDGDGTPGERNFGRGLLGTQKLLGRFNMPYKLMEFYLEGNYLYRDPLVPQEGFNINSLMPSGVATPSATELLEHFENLFGVTLDAPRRAIALEFIDPQTSGSTRARWNSTLPAVVKARVSGLVAIFANLPEVNVR